MPWFEAARLDDLPPGGSREFTGEGRIYALFRSPDGQAITCLDGLCPHQGGRLAGGSFDGSRVTCPRRGCLRWSFDAKSGVSSVDQGVCLGSRPVRVESGAILADLPGD